MSEENHEKIVLGLMAGTSVDGIDAALIKTDGVTVERLGYALTTSYDPATREAIFRAFETPKKIDDDLPKRIAQDHARAAEMLIAESGILPALIGFHGQTIFHAPQDGISLQIGDAGYLAQRLGVRVVHQFRQNDLAHSGQGAPLAPIYHHALMTKMGLGLPAAMVNIGGISNASIVAKDDRLTGLDLGPGNALMDDLAQHHAGLAFDKDGGIAAKGKADQGIVDAVMAHPFFAAKGPKSLDRKGLYALVTHEALKALSAEDHMATLVEITARGIIDGLRLNCPDIASAVICGGGSLNPVLMRRLKDLGSGIAVSRSDDHMIGGMVMDSRFIEAELMAYLAVRSERDLPITFPETTGVTAPISGGVSATVKFK